MDMSVRASGTVSQSRQSTVNYFLSRLSDPPTSARTLDTVGRRRATPISYGLWPMGWALLRTSPPDWAKRERRVLGLPWRPGFEMSSWLMPV